MTNQEFINVGGIYYRPDFVVYGVDGAIEHVYDNCLSSNRRERTAKI